MLSVCLQGTILLKDELTTNLVCDRQKLVLNVHANHFDFGINNCCRLILTC